jgi:hypothetical protein
MATDGTTFTAAERGLQVYTGTNRQVLVWGSQLSNTSTNLAYYATTTSAYTQCAPRGLLIEEQRSNAYLYSEDLTNAVWVAGDNTVTANAAVAPDGNSTADLLVPTTATTSHAFYQLASVTSGNTYTISLYAKAAGYSFINFYGSTGFDATQYINFSITSGTVSTSSGFTGTITSVGNGWYRCTVTAVSNATSASGRIVFRTYSATRTTASNSYTADGTSGAYIWGVQFELGAFASSYVPTTTAAATRSADIATMTGTNFSSWYNPIQWTMYSEYDVTWTGNSTIPAQTPYVFGIDNSANAGFNGYSMQENYQSNTARPRAVLRYSSTTTSLLITATTYATAGVVYKSIMAINSSEIAGTVNGQTTQTVSNPNYGLENLDQMRVGFGRSGGSSPYYINGHVRVLSYYPTRLSNGTLQTLTT